jgi:hypothetical protein
MGTTKPPDSPRRRFLYTDVSEEEYKKVQEYCRDKHISLSKSLADLLLEEANRPPRKNPNKEPPG